MKDSNREVLVGELNLAIDAEEAAGLLVFPGGAVDDAARLTREGLEAHCYRPDGGRTVKGHASELEGGRREYLEGARSYQGVAGEQVGPQV